MAKKILIPFPVPTSTIIAHHKDNPYRVYVIEQAKKHNGRLTLVGGRCELPAQDHETCIKEEWVQEAGGKGATLTGLRFWLAKNDRFADPRKTTLGKVTSNQCPKRLINQPVLGLYGCPDAIFIAAVEGEPYPNDGEAKQCLLIDVREIVITETPEQSKFGAQHDLLLALYRQYLDRKIYFEPVEPISDMADFRRSLLFSQSKDRR